MPSLPVNSKTFNLTNRINQTFSLLISGFQFATTLLFRIKFTIRATYLPKFTTKFTATINLKKVKLIISQMKLITSITQTISLKKIRIIALAKEIDKVFTTINLKIPMSFTSKAVQKVFSTILIKKLVFTFVPTLAHFFTLGDYDPDTLLTMDSQTLGALDFA